jgi:hypothetical protein
VNKDYQQLWIRSGPEMSWKPWVRISLLERITAPAEERQLSQNTLTVYRPTWLTTLGPTVSRSGRLTPDFLTLSFLAPFEVLFQKSHTIYTLRCLKKCCAYFTRILARRRKRAAGRPDHGAAGVGEAGDGLRNGANKSIGIGKNVVVLCSLEISFIVCR